MFKKTIVILACGALIAPMAFAQTRSTHKKQTNAATEQPITVTGTIIKMTSEEGSADQLPAGQDSRCSRGSFQ